MLYRARKYIKNQIKKSLIKGLHFLEKEEILTQLKQRLGIEDGESILSHHARLRRMINGILSVPPVLTIPSNIRIIGAINIDDTTHYLSPKVLDRAHVLQFQSPLNYWQVQLRNLE